VKRQISVLLLALLVCSVAVSAQVRLTDLTRNPVDTSADGGGLYSRPAASPVAHPYTPFSRFAFGAGVSPMGVSAQTATPLNRYANFRAVGNILRLNFNNISSNGFDVDAKMHLASAGASVDVYPFPSHGLRVSPGVLVYNTNAMSANFTAQPGTSFTLNGVTYYSSNADPVTGMGSINLHKQSPAFTLTAGWGNMIPRDGQRFSFPLEIGVAFTGAPDVALNLTSGQACDANGLNCVDVTTDPDVQANLAAQVSKYKNDLNPLKTYPIFSFGVAYSLGPRASRAN